MYYFAGGLDAQADRPRPWWSRDTLALIHQVGGRRCAGIAWGALPSPAYRYGPKQLLVYATSVTMLGRCIGLHGLWGMRPTLSMLMYWSTST